MTPPVVSITIPSFNQGLFLEQAIKSVIDQQYANLELFVIDGGSTDGSLSIIERYADRITWWTSERDGGQSDAINKGFNRSRGKYVNWLCSDDYLKSDALSRMTRFLEENPGLDGVFGNAEIVNARGDVIEVRREIPYDQLITVYAFNYSLQPSALFRREAIERAGMVRTDMRYSMDHELWLRMHGAGSRFGYLNETLSGYRYHSQSKGTMESAKVYRRIRVDLRHAYGRWFRWRLADFLFHVVMAAAFRTLRKWRKLRLHGDFSVLPFSWKIAWMARRGEL